MPYAISPLILPLILPLRHDAVLRFHAAATIATLFFAISPSAPCCRCPPVPLMFTPMPRHDAC